MAYRYLGNKTRLAAWVVDTIAETVGRGGVVADPMCGTGAVSSQLAVRGFSVVASDELRFPVLHAKARLLYKAPKAFTPVADSYEAAVAELNALPPLRGFFFREYGADGQPKNGSRPRGYFTGQNAARIDSIRSRIVEWRAAGLADDACDLLLHDLILAANKRANIAGTYGFYRSSWSPQSLAPLDLEPSAPHPTPGNHEVRQGKVESVAVGLDVDGCYLDPPYTKRQYGGNYHIPETLAQEDFPEPAGEGGLRDWYPQSSDFCSKRRVRQAFHETLKRLEVPVVFISYSEDGLVPPDELFDLLSGHGKVRRKALPIGRYRPKGGKSGQVLEHLYVVEKA